MCSTPRSDSRRRAATSARSGTSITRCSISSTCARWFPTRRDRERPVSGRCRARSSASTRGSSAPSACCATPTRCDARSFRPAPISSVDDQIDDWIVRLRDPRRVALYVDEAGDWRPPPRRFDADAVTVESWLPGRIALRVALAEGGLVATSIPGPAGWRARAGSVELATLHVDGAFLGVRIPPGVERVELDYRPPGFALGMAIGAAAVAIVLVLLIADRRAIGRLVSTPCARAGWAAPRGSARRRPGRRGDRDLSALRASRSRPWRRSSLLAARAVLVPRAKPGALAARERAGGEAARVPRRRSSR